MVTETECRSWGSFRQRVLIQPHETLLGPIKKVVAVSIPLPPGTENMGNRMLGPSAIPFNNEGSLLARVIETSQEEIDEGILDTLSYLYHDTEIVVREGLLDQSSQSVREYFYFQQTRQLGLGGLRQQAAALLSTPEFHHTSAWNNSYGGAFLQEWIFKDGHLIGTDPKGREMVIDGRLGKGNFGHQAWLDWLPQRIARARTVTLIDHFDGTASVSECGNKPGCSAFFRQMMHNPYPAISSANRLVISEYGHVSEIVKCFVCRKDKNSSDEGKKCRCNISGAHD